MINSKKITKNLKKNEGRIIECDGIKHPYPIIGKDIYLKSSLYIDHGEDDFSGGLCKIISIEDNLTDSGWQGNNLMVEVKEDKGSSHNWFYLCENQEKWKKEYGNRRGKPDPDYGGKY